MKYLLAWMLFSTLPATSTDSRPSNFCDVMMNKDQLVHREIEVRGIAVFEDAVILLSDEKACASSYLYADVDFSSDITKEIIKSRDMSDGKIRYGLKGHFRGVIEIVMDVDQVTPLFVFNLSKMTNVQYVQANQEFDAAFPSPPDYIP